MLYGVSAVLRQQFARPPARCAAASRSRRPRGRGPPAGWTPRRDGINIINNSTTTTTLMIITIIIIIVISI